MKLEFSQWNVSMEFPPYRKQIAFGWYSRKKLSLNYVQWFEWSRQESFTFSWGTKCNWHWRNADKSLSILHIHSHGMRISLILFRFQFWKRLLYALSMFMRPEPTDIINWIVPTITTIWIVFTIKIEKQIHCAEWIDKHEPYKFPSISVALNCNTIQLNQP